MIAALSRLHAFKPGTWLEGQEIDLYLVSQRLSMPKEELHALYVPLSFLHYKVQRLNNGQPMPLLEQRTCPYPLSSEEENDYRSISHFLIDDVCKIAAAILNIVEHHWFALVVDHRENRRMVYVFGKGFEQLIQTGSSALKTFESFKGLVYYRIICRLHGWDDSKIPTVVVCDWIQRGLGNCGAYSVDIIVKLFKYPLSISPYNGIPSLPSFMCFHLVRLNMLQNNFNTALLHLQRFQAIVQDHRQLLSRFTRADLLITTASISEYLSNDGSLNILTLREFEGAKIDIVKAMTGCQFCRQRRAALKQQKKLPQLNSKSGVEPTAKALSKQFPELRSFRKTSPPSPSAAHSLKHGVSNDISDVGPTLGDSSDPSRSHHTMGNASNNALTATTHGPNLNSSPSTCRRQVTQSQPPLLANIPFKEQYHQWNEDFDSYEGAPMIENTFHEDDELSILTIPTILYHPGHRTINPLSGHEEWRDRGWRLPSTFAQAFYNCEPVNLREHLIAPIVDVEMGNWPEVPCTAVSMEELSYMSQHDDLIALTGVNPLALPSDDVNRYLRVDIEASRLEIPDSQLSYVVDIDSFILIHRNPPFILNVDIFSTPYHRERAPLSVHNHVFVDIITPPYQLGSTGLRRDFWKKKFKLSNLPHMSLAHFPHGGDLLVFFPRMAHYIPFLPYWATNIPYHMKEMFYEHVVMPSIRKSIDQSSYQYQVQSQKAWRSQSSGSSRPKGISLTGGEFSEFVNHMRTEVNMKDWVFLLC